MQLNEGKEAPDFTLPDQNGKNYTLSDYKGHWVILYFYPKDDTPGCTKEACAFRDSFHEFTALGVKIFGISVDSVSKHKKFEEKYELPFVLLSDEKKEVVNLYEVWGKKKFMGREYMGINRYTFLINPQGVIAKIYTKVKPQEHAKEIVDEIKEMM